MKAPKLRDVIVAFGLLLGVTFGGRALATDKDIPGNVQALIVLILTTGLASEPLTEGVKRLGTPKKEEPHE